jgi:hypothetical protein
VPDWYKDLESYSNGKKQPTGNGEISSTIKRCMPVFDAIVSGYIIVSHTDVYISQKEVVEKDNSFPSHNIPYYEWPFYNPIAFHPTFQVYNYPGQNKMPKAASYPKWLNPWGIKTPPGYSTMFVSPLHRESIFTIMAGVVDTDLYTAPVNFPFVLNDWGFEGLIPAGTPIAQVIPFKRESWKMEIGSKKDIIDQNKVTLKLKTRFFDSYKTFFRQVKEYK